MSDYIEAALNDAPAQEAVVEEVVSQAEGEPEAIEEDVPFPKKAVNALSRKDKKIGSLTAKYQDADRRARELEQRLAAYEAKTAPQSKDGAPRMEDFESLEDYLEAKTEYKVDQKLSAQQQKQQETQQSTQAQQYVAQREDAVAAKAAEYITSIPDYEQVLQENSDILDDVPRHIETLFLEAEDGALAFYNLAKEGKLESLLTMTPAQAALAIARAEAKGSPAAKSVSKAPKPLAANKGTSSGDKSLDSMSYEELLKRL